MSLKHGTIFMFKSIPFNVIFRIGAAWKEKKGNKPRRPAERGQDKPQAEEKGR